MSNLSLCLTAEEVQQLTGKERATAQSRALKHMLIDHKRRPDGSVMVLRSSLEAANDSNYRPKRTEPNWN